jgi:hypothetical protein
MAQRFSHLGEEQFGFVAEAKESFGASQFFSGARDLENLFGSHRVSAGFSGVAAEGAVAAIVAAQIRQRQKNFSRVCNNTGLEGVSCGAGGSEHGGQIVVTAADQA